MTINYIRLIQGKTETNTHFRKRVKEKIKTHDVCRIEKSDGYIVITYIS